MPDTFIDPDTLLEVPCDHEAHAATIELLRQVAEHTDAHRHAGDKELADHGRALGRLSDALGVMGEHDEAIEVRRQALEIWEQLGRESAAHLARLKLVGFHDRAGDRERVDDLLEQAEREQAEHPDTLAQVYGLTLRHIKGGVLARRGEHELARALLLTCLEQLASRQHTPIHAQIEALLAQLD